jgi:hypothetical protein
MKLQMSLIGGLLAGTIALALGCNSKPAAENGPDKTKVSTDGHGHSHDGYWCPEHGVPEEICALCNSKVAADFKAKGDWCAKHDRPDSQCFTCHPELEKKFADEYEAKFGKKPPKES